MSNSAPTNSIADENYRLLSQLVSAQHERDALCDRAEWECDQRTEELKQEYANEQRYLKNALSNLNNVQNTAHHLAQQTQSSVIPAAVEYSNFTMDQLLAEGTRIGNECSRAEEEWRRLSAIYSQLEYIRMYKGSNDIIEKLVPILKIAIPVLLVVNLYFVATV